MTGEADTHLFTVPQSVAPMAGLKTRYPPSYIDKIKHFVQSLPVHYGITYSLLFIVLSAAMHIAAWLDGWLPAPQLSMMNFLFPLWLSFPLAFITYLDSSAVEALNKFSQILNISSETKAQTAYEFSTMPPRSVIVNSVVWSGIFCIYWVWAFGEMMAIYQFGPVGIVVLFVGGVLSFFVGGVMYYHTFRQLNQIRHIVGMVDRFDLFRLEPVYAFSILTFRTGICWVFLSSLSLLFGPPSVMPVQTLLTLAVQVVLALAAFFLPLRVVHRRLFREKEKLIAELDQRIKETLTHLHDCVDQKRFAETEKYTVALTGLATEGEILAKIPTLPWRPGLLTSFLSLIVLPIFLFLVQLAIQMWIDS